MAENNIPMAVSPGHPLSGETVLRISPSADQGKRLSIHKNEIRVATWNVRSLFQAGKLNNVTQEMKRLNINILGLSEVRWPGSGSCAAEGGTFYYSGNDDRDHYNGVGIILDKLTSMSVINFVPYSDRIMMIQLQTKIGRMNLIQVYAPTADKNDDEIEIFYEQLQYILKLTKKRDVTIVMGDYNAKIGEGGYQDYVGKFGLGQRNERGDRLLQFCVEEDLVISNTLFKLPKRRLYTWKAPGDDEVRIIRNQIDYILVNKKFRNSVKTVKTYPGADIDSDHNPVVMSIRIRLKRRHQQTKDSKLNIRSLQLPEARELVIETINERFHKLQQENIADLDEEVKWMKIRETIITTQQETIPKAENRKKQKWMTEEILTLMDERRRCKNRDNIKYREIQTTIKQKIRLAKEKWMAERCTEIEELEKKYDSFNLHKKVKEVTGNTKVRQASILKDDQDRIIVDLKAKLNLWQQYIIKLFQDQRPNGYDVIESEDAPEITREEVEYAIKVAKSGKAVGPDDIHCEVLKLLDEQSITVMVELFNNIYRTGHIPQDWLLSTFVPIPKQHRATKCEEHRLISLMSHVLKIFLKIIHARIRNKCEAETSDTQFGFRNGMGTREAIFALNVLSQRCLDVNQDLYICFIDYSKAFDNVKHEKLMSILQRLNIDHQDIQIIANLYWRQTARVRYDNNMTDEINIQKGVRQGCILSPMLFNIYSECIFQEALEDETVGVIINGRPINNIRYADDTVLIATSPEDLQRLLNKVTMVSEEYGLHINVNKTKTMVISKRDNNAGNLTLGNRTVENVQRFRYLGTIINQNVTHKSEILSRIEQARQSFMKLKKLLTAQNLSLTLRVRMVRCYVFSVLLYGLEGWTLNKEITKRLESFELWVYRRMLKISWTDRVTNQQVLERMNKELEVLFTIKKRKLEFLGHISRNDKYEILQLIMQGKIIGRRSVGRRRISWLRNLREWFGLSSVQLFRTAISKVKIAMLISNLRGRS